MRVALTFDAEHPDRRHRPGGTERVLETLALDRDARPRSSSRAAGPRRIPTLARSIADGGHLVGNHSHYHARMPLLSDEGHRDGRARRGTGDRPGDRRTIRGRGSAARSAPARTIRACWARWRARLSRHRAGTSTGSTGGRGDRPRRGAHGRRRGPGPRRRGRDPAAPVDDGDGARPAGTHRRMSAPAAANSCGWTPCRDDGPCRRRRELEDRCRAGGRGRPPARRGPRPDELAPGGRRGAGMERLAALVAEAACAGRRGRRRTAPMSGCTASPAPTRRPMSGCSTSQLAARGFAQDRPAPQRHVRGAARRHGPGLGRRRDLRPGRQCRGRRARRPTARLDALGDISGDWGGGTDVGWQGLAAAVRARDGRGPRTMLERSVPGVLRAGLAARADDGDVRRPRRRAPDRGAVAGRLRRRRSDGDAAARAIIDRLADELVAMAGAMIRRLRLTRLDPEIVLGGGVFRTTDTVFRSRIEAGVQASRRGRGSSARAPRRSRARRCSASTRWSGDRGRLGRGDGALGTGGLGRQGDRVVVEGRPPAGQREPRRRGHGVDDLSRARRHAGGFRVADQPAPDADGHGPGADEVGGRLRGHAAARDERDVGERPAALAHERRRRPPTPGRASPPPRRPATRPAPRSG